MSSPPHQLPSESLIEKHPPERRHRKKDFIVLYSCCCCCCCCLHTVGGALGALLGGAYSNYQPEVTDESSRGKFSPSSLFLFFLSFLITLLLTGLYAILGPSWGSGNVGERFTFGIYWIGIALILIGPAFLLGASVIMAIWLGLSPNLGSKAGYWASLGWMTLGNIIGTVLGVGVMYFLFVVLMIGR